MSANGLRPYPSYRDSGLDWLGEVPEHWEAKRIKTLARPGYKTFVDGDWIESPYITSDGIRLIQTGNIGIGEYREKGFRYISERTFDELGCTEFNPADVLICRLGLPVARACLAPSLGKRMITSVDVCILRPRDDVSPAYLVYTMSSRRYLGWVASLVRGSTRDRVSRSMLGGFTVPVPPSSEQTAIARYLDHADRRIRRYIRAKERLIELLEERKRALIHEAVTGRIDIRTGQPYPAYRDSGVEWLGQVPEHWEVRRNVWLFRERNETGFGSLPILEVSLHDGVGIRDMDDGQRKQQIVDRSQYKRAQEGDIAYNTMRMWQGAVGVVPVDGLVSPAYVVADPVECTESRYYGYLFRTRAYKHAVKSFSRGIVSDRDRLYWDDFKRLASLVPPPHEQAAIVGFLDHAVRRIRAAISATQRQIELVHEYRTRRIAEVVTGKLDVREAAATLSETDPLAGDGDRADAIPPESNLHSTAHDMPKEASA